MNLILTLPGSLWFHILPAIKMKAKLIRLAMRLGCGLVTLSRTGHAQTADPAAELQLRQQAMAALNAAIPKAETDPTRPVFHYRAPARWMNDICGAICNDGYHHIFYQNNPFSDDQYGWGWGHARSLDLVHWEELPFALVPMTYHGELRCNSGSATRDGNGGPMIFFTFVPQNSGLKRTQWAAAPLADDLIQWQRVGSGPLMEAGKNGIPADVDGSWSDPFVFKEAGRTFVTFKKVSGMVCEAQNATLTAWENIGRVDGIAGECPNVFQLQNKCVIINSTAPISYLTGDLVLQGTNISFVADGPAVVLDYGYGPNPPTDRTPNFTRGFYGTSTYQDTLGRTILCGWISGFKTGRGWNGCMSLPRILSLNGSGQLIQTPAPELEILRQEHTTASGLAIHNEFKLIRDAQGKALEILAEFIPDNAAAFGLKLRSSSDGQRGITLRYANGTLNVAGTAVPLTLGGGQPTLKLHVFLDRSVMEVFINDGQTAVTRVEYPDESDLGVGVFAENGKATLKSLDVWQMKSISAAAQETVALTSAPNPSVAGGNVTFTATLRTNGVTAGTMSFYDGVTYLGTVNVNSGVATFSTSTLARGSHLIQAKYYLPSQAAYYSNAPLSCLAGASAPLAQIVQAPTATSAGIVTNNLKIYFRADNVDGAGNPGTAATTSLVNLISPGTYNGTIVSGSGVVTNAGQAGTPYAYGVPLSSANLTRIEANGYRIAGGVNKVTAATWEFWLRLDASAEGSLYGEYASSAGSSTRHYFRALGLGGPNSYLLFDEYAPSGGAALSAGGYFQTSVFTQLVITKSGDTVRFYRNGTLFSTATDSETYSGSTVGRTWFGVRPNTTPVGTDGQFNIIRVYELVLSDAEVLQNYQAGLNPTSLALGSSLNPSRVGSNVTFTASVQTNGVTASEATGTVVFKDGAMPLSTNTLSNGVATCSDSTLALGWHTIWAEYGGQATYLASTNSMIQLVNAPAGTPTSIALVSSANPSALGCDVTFTAAVQTNGVTAGNAAGTVIFRDGATALSTNSLVGGLANFATSTLTVGSHSITVEYSGDANYARSLSGALSQVVRRSVEVVVTTASANNPSAPGGPVTFQAEMRANGVPVSDATGTMVFKDGTNILQGIPVTGAITYSYTYSFTSGWHYLTAEYSGDTGYFASTSSVPYAQAVYAASQTPTTLALGSSLNPSVVSDSLTLTASVLTNCSGVAVSSTGTVVFKDSAVTLGGGGVSNGLATLTSSALPIGVHVITAEYSGDAIFGPGPAAPSLSQTVQTPTSIVLTSSANPSTLLSNATFTVAVHTNGGIATAVTSQVYWYEGLTFLTAVNLTNGVATYTTNNLTLGAHSMTVQYYGDSFYPPVYLGSTSAPLVQVVQLPMPNTPTNLTWSVSGGRLTLSWPGYLGWVLQTQTNALDGGLTTNWTDMAGTREVTSTNLVISTENPAVFFRLRDREGTKGMIIMKRHMPYGQITHPAYWAVTILPLV